MTINSKQPNLPPAAKPIATDADLAEVFSHRALARLQAQRVRAAGTMPPPAQDDISATIPMERLDFSDCHTKVDIPQAVAAAPSPAPSTPRLTQPHLRSGAARLALPPLAPAPAPRTAPLPAPMPRSSHRDYHDPTLLPAIPPARADTQSPLRRAPAQPAVTLPPPVPSRARRPVQNASTPRDQVRRAAANDIQYPDLPFDHAVVLPRALNDGGHPADRDTAACFDARSDHDGHKRASLDGDDASDRAASIEAAWFAPSQTLPTSFARVGWLTRLSHPMWALAAIAAMLGFFGFLLGYWLLHRT